MARRLAPSVLNADLAQLAQQVRLVQDVAEWIHLDLMDGHFVPNLSFGPPLVAALRPHTHRFLDCHLTVDNPVELLPALAEAGADAVTMHVEALGGQGFRRDVLPKLAAARRAIDASGRSIALQVDGGVNLATLGDCLAAGADVFVVGTAIFRAEDPTAAAKMFRSMIDEGRGPGPDERAGEA